MIGLIRRQVEITNSLGLHLRAATRVVQLSGQFQAAVRVSYDDRTADGRSILDLLTLAAGCGARLELEANGPDSEAAIAALSLLFEEGLRGDEGGSDELPGP